ncbi:YihY/virulence factor BrkB family protein [Microbacterium koreense]|uniref:YihY/virulence factor BrkB family protein n=1 Tax=Microbacterium koreense TaxID=323761 RepID=A0ABW2ZU65_9MICO
MTARRHTPPAAVTGQSHADAADAARAEEETLRVRWQATQESLLERFDAPISRATKITEKTLRWFPVRVWRHFLQHNGFLLAAGVSYQALFAIFAMVYVAFAVAGLWLGGSEDAVNALINIINSYIPDLISDQPGTGLFTTQQVTEIAKQSAGVLGVTGIIALGTLIWTAIGFVTFARRAVRDIFGIPPDRRNYFLLKAADLVTAAAFGIALLLGFAATSVGTWALSLLFDALGVGTHSVGYQVSVRIASILVSFVLYTAAVGALVKFLTGTSLHWRQIWVGALLGGGAITVLQLGAGWLLSYTPRNPLLATFAIFVGLLLWFRIIGIILLVASAWIAVSASDENVPLIQVTEAQRLADEHQALLVAARVRLRTAEQAYTSAPWYRRWSAERAVHDARRELEEVEAAAPAPMKRSALFE